MIIHTHWELASVVALYGVAACLFAAAFYIVYATIKEYEKK